MSFIVRYEDPMEGRRSVHEIIEGLDTTSAKIRALAQAGYDRTEISRQLGSQYQGFYAYRLQKDHSKRWLVQKLRLLLRPV
jgi:hypothetical protein